jgi:ABC-type uncharacterized transport system auxiliary subunit
VGACTGLFHSTAQPEQTYYLRPLAASGDAVVPAAAGAAPSLRVSRPVADPGLDTSHIVLVQPDHRMDFYAGSRWPGPVPQLVEALAVQTLRASGAFRSVEDSTSPFPSDYLLHLTVRRFEADYSATGVAPQVHIVLDCLIGRREGREVVASFVAAGSATASANRLGDVVAAFEQATARALGALSQQAAQTVQAATGRSAQNAEKPEPSSSRDSQ